MWKWSNETDEKVDMVGKDRSGDKVDGDATIRGSVPHTVLDKRRWSFRCVLYARCFGAV